MRTLEPWKDMMLQSSIRVCTDIENAQDETEAAVSIFHYNPRASGAEDYLSLADEVIEYDQDRQNQIATAQPAVGEPTDGIEGSLSQ